MLPWKMIEFLLLFFFGNTRSKLWAVCTAEIRGGTTPTPIDLWPFFKKVYSAMGHPVYTTVLWDTLYTYALLMLLSEKLLRLFLILLHSPLRLKQLLFGSFRFWLRAFRLSSLYAKKTRKEAPVYYRVCQNHPCKYRVIWYFEIFWQFLMSILSFIDKIDAFQWQNMTSWIGYNPF